MRVLVQRVANAKVEVDGKLISKINKGMLIFVGVEKDDTKSEAEFLSNKVANLRIFEDEAGKMNLSVQDISGQILVVSQFTLAGDTSRGNRPGFETAAKPDIAEPLYEYFAGLLSEKGIPTQKGIFQADMKVSLLNDGPVTFWLEKRKG